MAPAETGEVRGAEFLAYYEQMITGIRSNWTWPVAGETDLAVTVRFGVTSEGRLTDLRLVSSSGDQRFDRSALEALARLGSLGPPPDRHRRDFSTVELVFRSSELGR